MNDVAIVCPNCGQPGTGLGIPPPAEVECPSCGAVYAPDALMAVPGDEGPLDLNLDLPAARESIPRPEAVPGPPALEDLLLTDASPHAPGAAGADPSAPSGGVDLMDPLEIQGAPATPAPRGPGAATPGMPSGLDLFLGELPSAKQSPLAPLDLDLVPAQPDPAGGVLPDLDLSGLESPAPGSAPPAANAFVDPLPSIVLPAPDAIGAPPDPANLFPDLGLAGAGGSGAVRAPAPPAAPMDIGSMFDSLMNAPAAAGASNASSFGVPVLPAADGSFFGAPAGGTNAPAGAGLLPDLGLGEAAVSPGPPTPGSLFPDLGLGESAEPVVEPKASGFSLRLEPGAAEPAEQDAPRTPQLPSPAPGEKTQEALPEGVPRLAPPRRKTQPKIAEVPQPGRRRVILIGAGTAVVALAGAVFFLTRLAQTPAPEKVLEAYARDLARDVYPSYNRAAEALLAAGGEEPPANLRAAAAELLLLAHLARGGERALQTKAEALLGDLGNDEPPPPQIPRARALLAIAKGSGSDLNDLLGAAADSPEGHLISGLRRMRENKLDLAQGAFDAAAKGRPDDVLARYLLGRSFDLAGDRDKARSHYAAVIEQNPDHVGALVGLATLEQAPATKQRPALEALLAKIATRASPGELALARVALGRVDLELGRLSEALVALNQAVAADPRNLDGLIALSEAMMAEGRSQEALTKLQTAGAALIAMPVGRLAMGAALVASGQPAAGRSQIEGVAGQLPTDPRVPHWLGMAAEKSRPPDLQSAISAYRQALERDPRFLPSTLRLAALLQGQGKPQEAVGLIKQAEKAGAPAEALEIAWGQALMEARSYAEAEAVLRKAVKHAPQRPGARIALAATLEASGQTGAAEAELKRAIDELEEKAGLRQRLADLYVRVNRKEEALAQLDAGMAEGGGSNLVRVRIAKLALSLDQLNRSEKELLAVVDEDPATPEALFTLGLVREARGEAHNAISDLKRALAFESSPDLHMAMARTLIAVGKDGEALGHLDAVGERADALLERARIRLRRQEIDQALADADAAAELDPNDGRALFLKGQCLDLIGRSDEAAQAWRGAVKASPGLAEGYYRIGRYEMDRGQQSAALKAFRMAASKNVASKPWEGDLYFQLGFAEAATGSRSSAAAAFRRYLDLAPEDAPARPEAERQLARLGGRGS